ncbi:hypothetical protein Taro_037321 [Colocasia esculenta]|uniref:Uncharacterized protein n=1 Tax=Colocasia esculenta TaxID=4460 RepID=A0A843W063_COLES|nr:hypothetical protein [Colocasia esculenta]
MTNEHHSYFDFDDDMLNIVSTQSVVVSTQSVVVSTLDPASRRPFLDKWDSVSTHSVVVSTHSG